MRHFIGHPVALNCFWHFGTVEDDKGYFRYEIKACEMAFSIVSSLLNPVGLVSLQRGLRLWVPDQ